MEKEKIKMEEKTVEQELSKLIAFTIQLEDELNNCIKSDQ